VTPHRALGVADPFGIVAGNGDSESDAKGKKEGPGDAA
jgi:hypothetical protein